MMEYFNSRSNGPPRASSQPMPTTPMVTNTNHLSNPFSGACNGSQAALISSALNTRYGFIGGTSIRPMETVDLRRFPWPTHFVAGTWRGNKVLLTLSSPIDTRYCFIHLHLCHRGCHPSTDLKLNPDLLSPNAASAIASSGMALWP